MTADWLSELKALALAATPEPWRPHGQLRWALTGKNWHYVLALSPERVLALIACVEAADDADSDGAGLHERKAYRAARAKLGEA